MPTVLRHGPYRFFFYAGDRDEPPHVHIERDSKIAKLWLDPVDCKIAEALADTSLTNCKIWLRKT